MWSILAVAATSVFSGSAGMLSCPAALPPLIMAMLIFSIVGGPTLIGRSVCVALIFVGFSGASRFKSSLKCSTHLFRCSSMLVITMFPSLAVFSAVVAKSSTYLRLSVLMLLFTCLFTSVYSACTLAFSALVRLILIAAFLFLLS
uniref:Secreted peptide n=1 Tax=Schistosoma curassoni TaxID=6186 RepID=A0A183L809_9TREM